MASAPDVLDPSAMLEFTQAATLQEVPSHVLKLMRRGNNLALALFLKLRASRKLGEAQIYPPGEELAQVVTHAFADVKGAHVDAGAGAASVQAKGLSTAGGVTAALSGWRVSCEVRGVPWGADAVAEAGNQASGVQPRRLPSVVFVGFAIPTPHD